MRVATDTRGTPFIMPRSRANRDHLRRAAGPAAAAPFCERRRRRGFAAALCSRLEPPRERGPGRGADRRHAGLRTRKNRGQRTANDDQDDVAAQNAARPILVKELRLL